jgi:hypothetical protein
MHTVADHLPDSLRLGRPQQAEALVVFPVFGGEALAEYVSLAEAQAAGVTIRELEAEALVNDLVVVNPTPTRVLLFEGEEVLGAQQNRIFDATVLVAAQTELEVPVSCVEAGRWDEDRHGDAFAPAPQVAYPTLRRGNADQSTVWSEIAAKSRRLAGESPTGAMHDLFESRRAALDALADAIERQDGQIGALVALGGRCLVLDMVSRPDVWAGLHRRLVQGYALDALEATPAGVPESAHAFLDAALKAPVSERPGVGAGVQVDVAGRRCSGRGLAFEHELLQLSVFAA